MLAVKIVNSYGKDLLPNGVFCPKKENTELANRELSLALVDLEEAVKKTTSRKLGFLGLLKKCSFSLNSEILEIHAFESPTRIRFLLLSEVLDEDKIHNFFLRLLAYFTDCLEEPVFLEKLGSLFE